MIVVTDRSHKEKHQGSPFFKDDPKECNGKLLKADCK